MDSKDKINTTIPVIFQKIEQVDLDDTRFTKVKIWLLHLNENLNGSYFEKPVVEEALFSLANTPILGYIETSEGEKDFTDHREILIIEDNKVKTKYVGKAVGVIPSDNNAKFELRVCDDGIEREFLTAEGLLWTGKFDDVAEIMLRDEKKSQSLELAENYSGEFKEDNLFHFSKFRFYGACILGKKVLPAMRNASIELAYSVQDFESEIQPSEIIAREIEAKLKEYKNHMSKQEKNNNHGEEGALVADTNVGQFSLSASQLRDELHNKLRAEIFTDRWGDKNTVYSYYDHKDNEVYAYDKTDNWNLYGFNFTTSGDSVEIDFASKKRKKLEVVDFADGEEVNLTFSEEMLADMTSDKEKEVNAQNADIIFQLKKENAQLNGVLTGIETEKKDALFEQYANLSGVEAFEKLRNNAGKFSIAELTKEIKVIAFDNNLSLDKFSASTAPESKQLVKTNFSKEDLDNASPYGNLFEQYLN